MCRQSGNRILTKTASARKQTALKLEMGGFVAHLPACQYQRRPSQSTSNPSSNATSTWTSINAPK